MLSPAHILDSLNEAQQQAVSAPIDAQLRVLAGAGSGKTRVLVHRIAWLLLEQQVSPWSILAVTFTNKAAKEMRTRIEEMLGYSAGGMWIGTFHGLAHRLLRRHCQEAGLPESFQIIDAEDQLRLVRRVLNSLELDENKWPPRQQRAAINGYKEEGVRPEHIEPAGDPRVTRQLEVYRAYEEARERAGSVDFAELLLRAHELLRDTPDLLERYQQRFQFIFVDEFQDTNLLQYAWLRLLSGQQGRLFVVGDDDQSIYGWRGARIDNILHMDKQYPAIHTIRLEQNYRSTSIILDAANALIKNNGRRLGKNLWTASAEGEAIALFTAYNDREEARYVAERVVAWSELGGSRSEVAVLYRSNAQSRVFEEALVVRGIPYRVYGGLRFFERAEIKDALSYLRLATNADDDPAFERVVNTPPRGIGARTMEALRLAARQQQLSLNQAARRAISEERFTGRVRKSLQQFVALVDALQERAAVLPLDDAVAYINEHSGLLAFHSRDPGGRGEDRVDNLRELINAAGSFNPDLGDVQSQDRISVFLSHAALEAGDAQGDDVDDCVQLMTLHSSKGLEFSQVFLCGLEDGLFPVSRALDDQLKLEEERRLCYVGITRAREQLILTHAERRMIYGRESATQPSRFLWEIPRELINEERPRAHVSRPLSSIRQAPGRLAAAEGIDGAPQPGAGVRHRKFGEGVVLAYEGAGPHLRVQVNFREAGSKWLVLAHAHLETL